MDFVLQKIKRDFQLKAVLYGLLIYIVIEWTFAAIVGGGWGLYALFHITRPYLEHCGQHCDSAAFKKYLDSAIAPYKELLHTVGFISSLVMFVLPMLGGFVAGRRARNAEIVNSALLGIILTFYSIACAIWDSNLIPPESLTPSRQATTAISIFLAVMLTTPVTVLGGFLARKTNSDPTMFDNSGP